MSAYPPCRCDTPTSGANTRFCSKCGGPIPGYHQSTCDKPFRPTLDKPVTTLAVRAPTPERGEQSEWRPIETAPKDGSVVLLFYLGGLAPRSVPCYVAAYWYRFESAAPKGWYNSEGGRPAFNEYTHWMPLPAPPVVPLYAAPVAPVADTNNADVIWLTERLNESGEQEERDGIERILARLRTSAPGSET